MLSRTGRLAVLRGRSAELKDSTSRSQIEVQNEGGQKTVTGRILDQKECG